VEQGKGATVFPTADVIDVLGSRQREAPWPGSRRGGTLSLPSYAPNPYEAPGCQELTVSRQRIFAFFPLVDAGIVGNRQRVLT
jgi:hypothetical protein